MIKRLEIKKKLYFSSYFDLKLDNDLLIIFVFNIDKKNIIKQI